ncbi:uncharacterized protein [Salminus brasiliensis]|uniref:uncharacterized protein n=1 Tax=Salminus brasiliensis TaxID=930266 RepID=UPI003B8377A6
MNSFKDATLFIDLSFLSAEEEAVIRQVLLRDEDLKRLEIGRVSRLRSSVPDPKQLKVLTGEWFEDLRSKRYGRQPAISAVVRSSMRWKKSAGHRPLPFLNAVPEEKEKEEKTRADVSADPRSIHPALGAEVTREYKDEDITLEVETQVEEPNAYKPNSPVSSAGRPKEKPQEELVLIQSPKPEPVLQPKSKGAALASPMTCTTAASAAAGPVPASITASTKTIPTASTTTIPTASTTASSLTSVSSSPTANTTTIPTASITASSPTSVSSSATASTTTIPTASITAISPTSVSSSATASTTTIPTASITASSPTSVSSSATANTTTIPTASITAISLTSVSSSATASITTIPTASITASSPTSMSSSATASTTTIPTASTTVSSLTSVSSSATANTTTIPTASITVSSLTSVSSSPTARTKMIPTASITASSPTSVSSSATASTTKIPTASITVSSLTSVSSSPTANTTTIPTASITAISLTSVSSSATNTTLSARTRATGAPTSRKTSTIASATTAEPSTEPRTEVSLPPALQKDRSFEENWVKTRVPPVETLEITSFTETRDTSGPDRSPRPGSSADPISTGPEVEAAEVIVSSEVTKPAVEQKQTLAVTELVVIKEGSGFAGDVAQSQSLREDPKGAPELISGSQQERESSPKLFAVSSVEMMKNQPPPSNAEDAGEGAVMLSDFKRTSPTRMDELDVEESHSHSGIPDVPGGQSAEPVIDPNGAKDTSMEESGLLEAEVVIRNAAPERTRDLDVELKESEGGAGEKTLELDVSEEGPPLSDTAPENNASKEEHRRESEILAGVYARALRSKSPASKHVSIQDPKQERAEDLIPTIVILPSESATPKEMESEENGTSAPGAPAKTPATPTFVVDTWEDEGVDSDDDSSSVSSYGSDLSGRRGFSASTLSVTERTGSLLSVYSDAGDFGNVAVQGSVEFALMYSPLGELVIMVEQCQDLAIANPRKQRTDPYVKTYLYPDKRSKRKTSIKKRTVNPVYVEALRYKVKREELPGKTLNLSVWHNDSLGRNVFLGQVEISLRMWDWAHEALTWYNLQPKNADNLEAQEYRGLLSVSLKYVPPEPRGGSKLGTGEIHIWLREARQLRRLRPQGVDSFVKCYMLPDTSKKSRQKTRVVKKSLNPVYNHTMVYDGFRPDEVREACCELTVWDNNKLSNQFLGGMRLSLGTGQSYGKKVDWMDSANEEVEIWEKMMAKPNSWVEAELPLRASMTPRK